MKKLLLLLVLMLMPLRVGAQQLNAQRLRLVDGPCVIRTGTGSPEGVVTGNVCDVYVRSNGSTGTTLYVKESGTGNTGWAAVGGGASAWTNPITSSAVQAIVSDETGTGAMVFGTAPTFASTITFSGASIADSPSDGRFRLTNNGVTAGITFKFSTDSVAEVRNRADNAFASLRHLYEYDGSGTPEASVTAPIGSIYHRTNGSTGTSIYIKESGTGNTGWTAVGSGGSSTNALLDGTNHTDTLAGTVVRGDVIVGNSTPKWSRLARCTALQFIGSDGTDTGCVDLFGTQNVWTNRQKFEKDWNSSPFSVIQITNTGSTSAFGSITWMNNASTVKWRIGVDAGAELDISNNAPGVGNTNLFTFSTAGAFTATTVGATTSTTTPLVIGGTGTTSNIELRATSNAGGTTGADVFATTGNNGGTELWRSFASGGFRYGNSGSAGIGSGGINISVNGGSAGGGYTASASSVANGNFNGWIEFGTTGTAGGEKRLGSIYGVLSADSTTTVTGELQFFTTNAGSITKKLTIAAAGLATFTGSVTAVSVRGTAVAFASVPTPVEGMLVPVTDSTTTTWGATITGGGANHVLAYYNGTNWTVAGK